MQCIRPEPPARGEETLLQKCEIPIIDLAHIGTDTCPLRSTTAVVRRVGEQLYKALSERGMAALVNHGIADDKLRAVYADLDKFCALPETCREQYLRDPDTNHGYVRPGMETFDHTKKELRHTFNIRSLSAEALPASDEVPGFLQHAQPLARDFTNLSRLLLRALATALGMSPSALVDCHSGMMCDDGNATTMRLLYYPPVPPDDERDGEGRPLDTSHRFTRCGAHADYGTFTLLAQDSAGGLEVLLRESDKWQPVGHLQGAILVQPGEMLANWTANLFPALMHRVVVPSGAHARARGRHCLAFFCHPDADAAPLIPPRAAPTAAASPLPQRPHHLSLHDRLVNAAHHLQKRFRETYA